MELFVGTILLLVGFTLGYITRIFFGPRETDVKVEEYFTSGAIPRADCMPPGCGDYPECNHRY